MKRQLLVCAVVLLALSARAFAADSARNISAADDGKTITITTVDAKIVRITLEGNPTTGYSWTVAKIDGKSLVQKGDVVYTPSMPDAGMVGAGGVSTATFDVKDLGKTTITMEYKRPWEKDIPAAKTFTVTVNVVPEAVTQPAAKP